MNAAPHNNLVDAEDAEVASVTLGRIQPPAMRARSDNPLTSPLAMQLARMPCVGGNDLCGGGKATARAGIPGETLLWKVIVLILAASFAAHDARAAPWTAVMVAPGVYALPGTGGEIGPQNGGRVANVALVIGPRGVIVVDTGISYREGEQIIAAVRRVTNRPIRLAIVTHPSQEAIFGAAAFQAQGIPVLAHRSSAEMIAARCETCLRNLRSVLGEEMMAATRVIQPDRLIDGDEMLDVIGRPLLLIAPPWSSAPGAIAVFDESTSTLIAGNLVAIHRIPDMRDADPKAWRDALVQLASLRCRHLIPGYGPIGKCADIRTFTDYFAALDSRVEALMKSGVSLAELRDRIDLPEFARWDQYGLLHPQNANYTYLRIERLQFECPTAGLNCDAKVDGAGKPR